MGLLSTVVVGVIIGYFAWRTLPRTRSLRTLALTAALGLAGAFAGGVLGQWLYRDRLDIYFGPLGRFFVFGGAVFVLLVFVIIYKAKHPKPADA